MATGWLRGWGLAAIAFGGASLIVPLYVMELGGGAVSLGVLFASASFVGVPGALLCGTLADRTGKRRIFVLSAMSMVVFAMVAIPFLRDIPLVIVVNALLWLGFAAAVPVLNLLVVADEPSERWSRLIARLNAFQGVGWAVGLALGFGMVAIGSQITGTITAQRAFFLLCAGSGALGMFIAARTLPPDPAVEEEPSRRRLRGAVRDARGFNVRGAAFPFSPARFDPRHLHPRRLVGRMNPQLRSFFLAVFLFFAGFGVFFAPLPVYLAERGIGPDGIFGLYLLLNGAAALFFGRAGILAETYNLSHLHVGGLVTRAGAIGLVPVTGVVAWVWIDIVVIGLLFIVIGLTWAVIAVTTATLVTRLATPEIRGEALGIHGGLGAIGGGVGGLCGGLLAGVGYSVTFAGASLLILLASAIVYSSLGRSDPWP